MKTITLLLFMAFYSLSSIAYSDDNLCDAALAEHMDLIATTDTYFRELAPHADRISSFEITQVQKKLTMRYVSLKNLFKMYDDETLNCPTKIMPTAVAIYDFSKIADSIFASKYLRRVVLGFIKYPQYDLTDFKAYYNRYTNPKLINYIQPKIAAQTEISDADKTMFEAVDLNAPSTIAASDIGIKGTTSVVAGVARTWGFISDHLKWRQGRLKDNADAKALLLSNLKPLDLIYEKRTFVLSNYTIPGHFGHVGIWLGTKEQLIALGIWDQDYFKLFRPYVEAGQSIIEMRKPGVGHQSLDTFINLDEIAITRVKNIITNAPDIFANLEEQVNKTYDYKFDAHTEDQITCSELVSFSYGDVKWHETKTLFQTSLRPDDMALPTLDPGSQSEFVLYLKGDQGGTTFQNIGFEGWSQLFAK